MNFGRFATQIRMRVAIEVTGDEIAGRSPAGVSTATRLPSRARVHGSPTNTRIHHQIGRPSGSGHPPRARQELRAGHGAHRAEAAAPSPTHRDRPVIGGWWRADPRRRRRSCAAPSEGRRHGGNDGAAARRPCAAPRPRPLLRDREIRTSRFTSPRSRGSGHTKSVAGRRCRSAPSRMERGRRVVGGGESSGGRHLKSRRRGRTDRAGMSRARADRRRRRRPRRTHTGFSPRRTRRVRIIAVEVAERDRDPTAAKKRARGDERIEVASPWPRSTTSAGTPARADTRSSARPG
jgi:hypothetical protein